MQRNSVRRKFTQLTLLSWGVAAAVLISTQAGAYGHGAKIEVSQQAIAITATFDTGEPMANAQVSIYAPDELDTPWQTGQTDSEGQFLFEPSAEAQAGTWEVIVRKAGHGQTTTFALGNVAESEGSSRSLARQGTTAQKWLSMAAILWGFFGTALYFSRKENKKKSVSLMLNETEGEERETVVAGLGSNGMRHDGMRSDGVTMSKESR